VVEKVQKMQKNGQNPTAKNPLYSVSKLNAQTEMQDIVFF
jgi:hypothetical protein